MNQTLISVTGIMAEAVATGLFVSLCTIQRQDGELTDSGATSYADAAWPNLAGHVDIPCMSAVPSVGMITATERDSVADILSAGYRHVLLNDYYPAIQSKDRAVVDGVTYDILGAEPDSQGQMTRLMLKLVVF